MTKIIDAERYSLEEMLVDIQALPVATCLYVPNGAAMLEELLTAYEVYPCMFNVFYGYSDAFCGHVNDALDEGRYVALTAGQINKSTASTLRYNLIAYIAHGNILTIMRPRPHMGSFLLSKRRDHGILPSNSLWTHSVSDIKELVSKITPVPAKRIVGAIKYVRASYTRKVGERNVPPPEERTELTHILMQETHTPKGVITGTLLGRLVSQTQSYKYDQTGKVNESLN